MPENPNSNESPSGDARIADNDLCERVQRLREKTERLSETLDEVKTTLREAAEPKR